MQINLEEKSDISVFRVEGDIDINSSPEFKKYFDKKITNERKKIIVNLTKVDYVDSSGLATLVEVLKNLRSKGGKLKLTNLSAKVRGLFEITKLDKLFDISMGEDDALRTF